MVTPRIEYLKIWELLTERFALGELSLHGPRHWRNVEENGRSLAEVTGADLAVVRLFGVFHDSERHNESMDPNHGLRAAELVKTMHGDLFSISDEQLETLCDACEFHNHGMTSEDATIGTCWDADRLDLPRVGIRPEAKYMSTEEGRRRTIV